MRPLALLSIVAIESLGLIASTSLAETPSASVSSPPPGAPPPPPASNAPGSTPPGAAPPASSAPGSTPPSAAPPASGAPASTPPSAAPPMGGVPGSNPPNSPAAAPPPVAPSPAQPPTYGPLPPYGQPAPYYPGAPPLYGAPAAPAVPLDARSHSGFFLRMALGGGFLANTSTLTGGTYRGGVDATGGALGLELSIGGALSPGIILAGSYTFQSVGNANLKNDTRNVRVPHDPTLTLLGAMLDVYPNAKGGFHLGGALGIAAVTIRNVDDNDPKRGGQSGFGFAPHVGYEWWVGNYWGLGVLGKLLLARSEGDYGDSTDKNTVTGVSIMFSATYN